MKKIVFFLLAALTLVNVKAQTYQETQHQTSKEISSLNICLNQIKDKIYYYEVTLEEKLNDAAFIKKQSLSYLSKLKKEKFFAQENLENLKIQKEAIEKTLKELTKVSLASTEARIKTDAQSNLPEQMGRREYKRRTRSQMFAASQEMLSSPVASNGLSGILINYKTGVNEIATFKITRIGFPEFPAIIKALDPQERVVMNLPIGEYYVEIDCGNYHGLVRCSVDPRVIKHCDKKEVYWFACKLQSDL
jgi:hypothetical protein